MFTATYLIVASSWMLSKSLGRWQIRNTKTYPIMMAARLLSMRLLLLLWLTLLLVLTVVLLLLMITRRGSWAVAIAVAAVVVVVAAAVVVVVSLALTATVVATDKDGLLIVPDAVEMLFKLLLLLQLLLLTDLEMEDPLSSATFSLDSSCLKLSGEKYLNIVIAVRWFTHFKYHWTADLLFYWFGHHQTNKSVENGKYDKAVESKLPNRKFSVQWYLTYKNWSQETSFCLRPTAKGTSNFLSCFCSSGHFVNLLLGCTSGVLFWGTRLGCSSSLNLAVGPVVALFQTA